MTARHGVSDFQKPVRLLDIWAQHFTNKSNKLHFPDPFLNAINC